MVNEPLDPKKYKCIRCKAPADIIFKNLLPFCFPHEPAESKAAREPKEDKMEETAKIVETTTDAPAEVTLTPSAEKTVVVSDGWTVFAKDGSVLHNGFASKKLASGWAKVEVEAARLKAGQYKILKAS